MTYDNIPTTELIARANALDNRAQHYLHNRTENPVKLAKALMLACQAIEFRKEYIRRTGEPAPAVET